MNCNAEVQKNYSAPSLADVFRLLLGLTMMFAGLYIVTLSEMQGHGLGLLLVLGSPFMILNDNK